MTQDSERSIYIFTWSIWRRYFHFIKGQKKESKQEKNEWGWISKVILNQTFESSFSHWLPLKLVSVSWSSKRSNAVSWDSSSSSSTTLEGFRVSSLFQTGVRVQSPSMVCPSHPQWGGQVSNSSSLVEPWSQAQSHRALLCSQASEAGVAAP